MRAIGPMLLLLATACRVGPTGAQPAQRDSGIAVGDDDDAPITTRIATWNVEGVGAVGTDEHEALAAVLARLDADVVALNEVDAFDADALDAIAADLGYDHVIVPSSNPFGDLRNAVLSRLPVVEDQVWTSAALSGDDDANDLTRLPISVTVEVAGATIAVVGQHWKSGWDDVDELRRAIDGIRTAQVAARVSADHVLVVGDMNHEVDEAESPARFESIPAGAPSGFWVGADLYARLEGDGLDADPFLPLADLGLAPIDAQQADGRWDTRDTSGRRLDYVHGSASVVEQLVGAVVYDSRDDDRVTLPLAGDPPARDASARASDHFPVVVEVALGRKAESP